MLLFLYHFAWTLMAIPLSVFSILTGHRRLQQRLALSLSPGPPRGKSIWIHALSVGEVISALPVVRALRKTYPSEDIVFTVSTSQGMEIARKELQTEVRELLTMPLDFWWSIERTFRAISPKLFMLVETDLWPGLLHYLKQKGIATLLINGRVSPRTFRSYRRCPFFVRKMYRPVDLCFMQTDLDRARLLQVGIEPHKVRTLGNIKFDRDWLAMAQEESDQWLRRLHLSPEDQIWVAGSTHHGEDVIVLDVFERLLPLYPQLRLIIAPRKVEEAAQICRLAMAKGLKPLLKTELNRSHDSYRVLVLNTMGELGRIYGIASISFVGGSLVPMGGHNLLEPASFGCPVLFGPNTQDFDLMSELLIEAGGGMRLSGGEELFLAMKELLSHEEKAKRMGRRAKTFVEMHRGALTRMMDQLRAYLER